MWEMTVVIIKPDAVKQRVTGEIIQAFEARRELSILEMRRKRLYRDICQIFYAEHKDKPFFAELTQFMSSGDIVAAALAGEGAVSLVREMLGHTDPSKAAPGSLRAKYGRSITQNALHGSDSRESAEREAPLIFSLFEFSNYQL